MPPGAGPLRWGRLCLGRRPAGGWHLLALLVRHLRQRGSVHRQHGLHDARPCCGFHLLRALLGSEFPFQRACDASLRCGHVQGARCSEVGSSCGGALVSALLWLRLGPRHVARGRPSADPFGWASGPSPGDGSAPVPTKGVLHPTVCCGRARGVSVAGGALPQVVTDPALPDCPGKVVT